MTWEMLEHSVLFSSTTHNLKNNKLSSQTQSWCCREPGCSAALSQCHRCIQKDSVRGGVQSWLVSWLHPKLGAQQCHLCHWAGTHLSKLRILRSQPCTCDPVSYLGYQSAYLKRHPKDLTTIASHCITSLSTAGRIRQFQTSSSRIGVARQCKLALLGGPICWTSSHHLGLTLGCHRDKIDGKFKRCFIAQCAYNYRLSMSYYGCCIHLWCLILSAETSACQR